MFQYVGSFSTNDECVQYYDHLPMDISSNEFGMHDFALRTADGERIQHHYTIHFVLRGKGTYSLAGTKYAVSCNDIFVTPPGVKVATIPDANDPWKYFWLGFCGNDAPHMIKSAMFTTDEPVFASKNTAEIREIISELLESTSRPHAPFKLFAISALLKIFATLTAERNKSNPLLKATASTNDYIYKAIRIIEKRYADPTLKTEDICKELSVSHSFLCRIFNKYTIVTAKQYLIQYRLLQARVLLETTTETVQRIAYLIGYGDYIHFNKEFKRAFNYTPLQYRAATKKKQ